MKKYLNIILGVGFMTTATTSVVSCSWTTPPLQVDKIQKIVEELKSEVLSLQDETDGVANIENAHITLGSGDIDTQDESTARIWYDGLTGSVSSILFGVNTGRVNIGHNIVNESDSLANYKVRGISKDDLNKMQGYYVTVRIADIYSKDKKQWLTNQEGVSTKEFKVDKKVVPVDEKNKPTDGNDKLSINYSFMDLNNIWAVNKETFKSTSYTARTLISFLPTIEKFKDAKPNAFYIDIEMEA